MSRHQCLMHNQKRMIQLEYPEDFKCYLEKIEGSWIRSGAIVFALFLFSGVGRMQARAESFPPGFSRCSRNDLYNNDCLKGNGIELLSDGLAMMRRFQVFSGNISRKNLSALVRVPTTCNEFYESKRKTSDAILTQLNEIRCSTEKVGNDRAEVPTSVIYNVPASMMGKLHWQWSVTFMNPIKYESRFLSVSLFLRTTLPGPCPSTTAMKQIPDLLSNGPFQNAVRVMDNNSAGQNNIDLWVLQSFFGEKASLMVSEITLKAGVRCQFYLTATRY